MDDKPAIHTSGGIMDNRFTCKTCRVFVPNTFGPMRFHVAGIGGDICKSCNDKLRQPTMLEGCVSGPSIEELGRKIEDEFDKRRDGLLKAARIICGGES